MSYEDELDKLFADAIDVHDTIWYTKTQTLRDAIAELIESEIQAAIDNYEYEPPEKDEL